MKIYELKVSSFCFILKCQTVFRLESMVQRTSFIFLLISLGFNASPTHPGTKKMHRNPNNNFEIFVFRLLH